MDFSNFLCMKEEISLIAVMIILLIYDMFGSQRSLKWFPLTAVLLLGIHTLINFLPREACSAFGGMYEYTPIVSVVKNILNVGTILVFLQARNWVNSENCIIRRGEYYFLTLSTLLGMYLMMCAGHFLMFFIGLEMASVPVALLATFDKYRRTSAEAGAKYILTATFSSAIMLFGISMLYGTTGTLYFEDMATRIDGSALQILGFVFFITGLFFKISLVPFHLWTADVYEGAPTNVTAYLSVISKGSAAFVLMVILTKVFGALMTEWSYVLYAVILLTITLANLFAIRQKNIKRFFAFSSISQAGYIMLGVMNGGAIGLSTLIYYVLVYMISNLAAFGVIAIIEHRSKKLLISDYNGLYSTNPLLSVVMMLSLFSLAGIPPFAGFFSKFFIFAAAAQQGYYILVLIALVNTIISLYYYLLIVKAMFINKSETPIEAFRSDGYTRVSLVVCTAGILLLGIVSAFYREITFFV